MGLSSAFVDGKIVGDIHVGSLSIGPNAVIYGDITCQTISIRKGSTIVGRVKTSQTMELTSYFPESKSIIEGFEDDLDDHSSDDENNDKKQSAEILPPPRSNRQVLVIYEPQIDLFEGGSWGTGKMDIIQSISDFILKNISDIDEIVVPLDSHNVIYDDILNCFFLSTLSDFLLLFTDDQRLSVFHSSFWLDSAGSHPQHGTKISIADLESGLWKPRNEGMKASYFAPDVACLLCL